MIAEIKIHSTEYTSDCWEEFEFNIGNVKSDSWREMIWIEIDPPIDIYYSGEECSKYNNGGTLVEMGEVRYNMIEFRNPKDKEMLDNLLDIKFII